MSIGKCLKVKQCPIVNIKKKTKASNLQLFLLTLQKLQKMEKVKNIAKEKRESDLQKIIKSSQKTRNRSTKKNMQEDQHEKKIKKKFYQFYIINKNKTK